MRYPQPAALAVTLAVFVYGADSASAQLDQLNAGGAAAAASQAGAAGAGAGQGAGQGGGTTEGTGGVTTGGPGSSDAQDGGIAGGNTATTFVGQNQAGGFVGGGVGTLFNNIRQFQAITGGQLPTGGTRETSGTPRRVPTSLRIAFTYPRPDAATMLIEPAGPAIDIVALTKPELRSVVVKVNQQGAAILTGSVPDAAARRLAANLVRLRPGVRTIQNQLAVAAQPPSPAN